MFHDNLVHSTAGPFKNDELMPQCHGVAIDGFIRKPFFFLLHSVVECIKVVH